MFSILLMTLVANAEWTDSQKKNFYLFCLSNVAEFKNGVMADPVLADGYCRCLTDILEMYLDKPTNEGIISFSESSKSVVVRRCPGSKPLKSNTP